MRQQARYVNHLGRSIELNAGDIHLSTGTLADWKYSYELLNGRPIGFYRKVEEESIGAVVVGYAMRDALHDIAVPDIAEESPGALWIGEWFLPCYLVGLSKDRTWLGPAADYTLHILPASEPAWTRIHEQTFAAMAAGGGMNFDYNFDYNFGDGAVAEVRTVRNPSALPAPVVLTVHGPATNPRLSIAGNVYECEVQVEAGGRLVIDGMAKKVELFDRWGGMQNVFSTRRGIQKSGSGSFAFQRIPTGTHAVSCPAGITVGVKLYELRDEWRWREDHV